MSADPDVSVVMSVCNGAAALRETVQSVLSQADFALELIVVNDGSTDETGEILEDLAGLDSRVQVLSQKNQGITAGLIRGCAIARGTYIARQDVGDFSLDRRLYLQKLALDAALDLSFVSCWTEVRGPAKEFLSFSKGSGAASTPIDIISEDARHGVIDGPAHHGSVMFRRDRYFQAGGYRSQFYFGQDWDLWYRLGEIGKFQMIEKVLYQACVTPNSLSGRYRNEQEAIAKFSHQALLRRRRGQPEDDLLEQAQRIRLSPAGSESAKLRAKGLYAIGEQLRRNGDPRAEVYFRDSLATSPTFLKPWLRIVQGRLRGKG